ncbi:MAG: hypothetical protein PF636_05245 [Actinomycetota bacterium]|jgi:hypothetical protein|nr:hypothetical protein [Actinomycetota bacterium]
MSSNYFIEHTDDWDGRECPHCGRPTIGHGRLFKDPAPVPPNMRPRQPVGEAYLHADNRDCEFLVEAERQKRVDGI